VLAEASGARVFASEEAEAVDPSLLITETIRVTNCVTSFGGDMRFIESYGEREVNLRNGASVD
jgi:hypothetical protein